LKSVEDLVAVLDGGVLGYHVQGEIHALGQRVSDLEKAMNQVSFHIVENCNLSRALLDALERRAF
jgi:hypothetical protein